MRTPIGLAVGLLVGCVSPEIAVVSRQTALERQAAGEYPESERALEQAALQPGPAMLPRDRIETSGAETESMLPSFAVAPTDAELLDELLVAGCVGEGSDGLLVPIQRPCDEDVEMDALTATVTHDNVRRRQIWDYLRETTSESSLDVVRERWRVVHLERVVCGAWVQDEEGTWSAKSCD